MVTLTASKVSEHPTPHLCCDSKAAQSFSFDLKLAKGQQGILNVLEPIFSLLNSLKPKPRVPGMGVACSYMICCSILGREDGDGERKSGERLSDRDSHRVSERAGRGCLYFPSPHTSLPNVP